MFSLSRRRAEVRKHLLEALYYDKCNDTDALLADAQRTDKKGTALGSRRG